MTVSSYIFLEKFESRTFVMGIVGFLESFSKDLIHYKFLEVHLMGLYAHSKERRHFGYI